MSLTIYFKHFVFMELLDLNSNLDNLFESSSIKDFSVEFLVDFLIDSLMCLNISFLTFLTFYCFLSLYFMVNISIFMTLFINFYRKFIVMKVKINSVA